MLPLTVCQTCYLFWSLWLLLVSVAAVPVYCQAGETEANDEVAEPDIKPLMCELGKLVLADDFSDGKMAKAWFRVAGKLTVEDGSLKASEVGDERHRIELSTGDTGDLDGPNLVIQYSFMFDGAPRMGVGIENPQGHVALALADPTIFYLGCWKGNKAEVAAEMPRRTWHTVLWEIYGKEMVAQLDGKQTLHVVDEKLAEQRTRLVLISWGDSGWFDKIRVWKASKLRADWPNTRDALTKE
jgi:hypothetical protein